MRYACVIGREGLVHPPEKIEGDYKTPMGTWPLREVWLRIDRVGPVQSALMTHIIAPDDGWCDEPTHAFYNKPIKLPFEASHEQLWRDDSAYDVLIPLGYNDDPVIAHKGSAIFIHSAHDDGRATAGCIALARDDMLALVSEVEVGAVVEILG